MDDGFIPRATAEKLLTEFPLGTRHKAKVDIAVPLIANGMAPAAVFMQLRAKFPDAKDREIEDVIKWVVSQNPTPTNGSGYRGNGNGNGTFRNGYGTLPMPPNSPRAPLRTPVEQMEWWLNGLSMAPERLLELSPLQIPPNPAESLALAIATLYEDEDKLNIVCRFTLNDKGKANPSGAGKILTKDQWIEYFAFDSVPMSDAGAWFRINPCAAVGTGKDGAICDKDITAFRYFLIEFDDTPLPIQAAFFYKLKLPVVAVLSSGGKSLHAWIKIGAANEEQFDERAKRITEALKPFGSDSANKNPSRLSRLPGAVRKIQAAGDGLQQLLYLNPMVPPLDDKGIRVFEESLLIPIVEDKPLLALAKSAIERYESLYANRGRLGVPLGIPELDKISGGLKPGQTTIIAGATGGCKTTLAIHSVATALENQYGVLLFSLEMDREEIFDLLVSRNTKVNRNKFNHGRFEQEDWPKLATQVSKMQSLPLYIEDSAMNNVAQIRLRTLQLAAEKRIGLIVVDYIQFVNPEWTKESREQQVAQISHGLRVLARESRLPMIVLSQLNDEGKLRESRVIAHNANTVLMVEVQKQSPPPDRLKISVVKGRGIPMGEYYLNFEREFARLYDEQEEKAQQRADEEAQGSMEY